MPNLLRHDNPSVALRESQAAETTLGDTVVALPGTPCILVVDDDQTTRMMLEGVLRQEGFRVCTARTGLEGREMAFCVKPDLVLMDVNMPGEDGLTACTRMKMDPALAEIPVIFLSVQEEAGVKVRGFAAGGADYVTKPCHVPELLARVRVHVRLRQTYQAMVAAHLEQLQTLVTAQQTLLPQPHELAGARFAAVYLPLQQVGGDFYDVFQAGDDSYDYLVADVSGHCLGTALPTAALKVLIRQNAGLLYSPLENLHLLNRHLRPVLHEGQYATLAYVRLNRRSGQATVLNAGHAPAVLARRTGILEVLHQSGDVLGAFDAFVPAVQLLEVSAGDRLFLFSDGLIEQGRHGLLPRDEGLTWLCASCDRTRPLSLNRAVDTIASEWLPQHLHDDVVLLGVEL